MKTNIIPIGNSRGVRIPKALLEQVKFEGEVDLLIEGENIVIKSHKKIREGWEEAFKEIASLEEDNLKDWEAIDGEFDEVEWQWQ